MGFTGAWAISMHTEAVVEELAARFVPAIAADQAELGALDRWKQWQNEPLPDRATRWKLWCTDPGGLAYAAVTDFYNLTSAGKHVVKACYGENPYDDDPEFHVTSGVWERQPDPNAMFFSCKNENWPLSSAFAAIGPGRAAQLPGWCGNFVLTPAEVRTALPQVEAALSFTPQERAAVDAEDWLEYRPDEETVINGPLRIWRRAVADGHGLCARRPGSGRHPPFVGLHFEPPGPRDDVELHAG